MTPRRSPPALRAIAAVLLLALVLPACVADSPATPPRASLSSLPREVRDRVDISAARVERVVPGRIPGQTVLQVPGAGRVRAEAEFSAGASRGLAVPMREAERIYEVEAVIEDASGSTRRATALKIDTGGSGQLSVSSEGANMLGVIVLEEFPVGIAHTGFGAKEVAFGVVGAIDFPGVGGTARLAPVQAQVDSSARRYDPLLGIAALEVFGGAYFDWGRRRLVLLPRGGTPAVQRERAREGAAWSSAPWTDEPFELRRDSLVRRGAGSRSFRVEGGLRWTRVDFGGRSLVGLIDTGFSGALFSFEPLGLGRPTGVVGASGFGRSARFDTFDPGGTVRVAGVEFDNAQIIEPREAGLGVLERGGFDVIVGLELLTQRAMWLDFERDRVRFWTGPGMAPTLVE